MNSPSHFLYNRINALPAAFYLALGCLLYCFVRFSEISNLIAYQAGDSTIWMEISAWLLTIIGVHLLSDVDLRFAQMLGRLATRNVLAVNAHQLEQLQLWLLKKANRYALIAGIVPPLVLLGIYQFVYNVFAMETLVGSRGDTSSLLIAIVLELMAAFIVGSYVGRSLLYSQFGYFLSQTDLILNVQPAHPDKLAGLRPIGMYYFRQALIALLPVLLLSIWCVLNLVWPAAFAVEYKSVYAGLLLLALLAAILILVLPLWRFRKLMCAVKKANVHTVDLLGKNIVALQRQLTQEADPSALLKDGATLAQLQQTYTAFTAMPTWPLDRHRIQLFAVSNILLLIPVLLTVTIG